MCHRMCASQFTAERDGSRIAAFRAVRLLSATKDSIHHRLSTLSALLHVIVASMYSQQRRYFGRMMVLLPPLSLAVPVNPLIRLNEEFVSRK